MNSLTPHVRQVLEDARRLIVKELGEFVHVEVNGALRRVRRRELQQIDEALLTARHCGASSSSTTDRAADGDISDSECSWCSPSAPASDTWSPRFDDPRAELEFRRQQAAMLRGLPDGD